jgi:hypothetical protein
MLKNKCCKIVVKIPCNIIINWLTKCFNCYPATLNRASKYPVSAELPDVWQPPNYMN